MNGIELRSFSHFQIITRIAYLDLSRNLETTKDDLILNSTPENRL